jgi:hypothetical protein
VKRVAPFLAFLAAAGPSSCPPPSSAQKAAQCAKLYDQCVDASESQAEYRTCRDAVDVTCLDVVSEDRL